MRVAILGVGGFTRQILDMIPDGSVIVDREESGDLEGFPVISERDLDPAAFSLCIAIAETGLRRRIAERFEGSEFSTLVADTARISRRASVGEGAILCHNTLIEPTATVGRLFHCNIYSYVAHDCVIGDYVTFGPRVNCNGSITIGDGAYIGSGATIRQGLTIGAGATVGMGAVVTKDVPAGETWVANPARPIEHA